MAKKKDKALAKNSEPNSKNVERALTHAKYYATNIYGAVTTQDFRIEFLNEKGEFEDGWFFQSDAMAILSPTGAKRLQLWLDEAVKEYEREHGKIPAKFEVEKKY